MKPNKNILLQALSLAQIRRGFCAPNPSVGAIITNDAGNILATGYHLGPGTPHAEIDALKKLTTIPENAILYVTLEPCCHFGRTPPCTEAIIQSGIKKVFYSYQDPNPIVAGHGHEKLIAANIHCEHISLAEINQFYESYHYWHTTKKPFITAKIAVTADGKTSGKNGERIQITGDEINQFTHQQRKIHDAILTTAQTIIADDPQLNVRLDNEVIAKPIYILDTHLRLPLTAKIFQTAKSITVFHATGSPEKLIAAGVRCIKIPAMDKKLDLNEVINFIGKDGVHDLWIEAGATCFSSFLQQKLLQRALIYVAPHKLNHGQPTLDIETLIKSQKYTSTKIGKDMLYEIKTILS